MKTNLCGVKVLGGDYIVKEKYTKESIDDAIRQLGILLEEIIADALNTRYIEKYEDFDFDTITSFECMLDDINRINKVINLHDALVTAGSRDLLYAFTGDVDNLYIGLMWREDLQKLLKKIKEELEKEDRGF